jgi:electron transport complex protein RnfB
MKATVNQILEVLPQTQCRECGYPGCLPYAQALHAGQAPVDRCPPGGLETLERLATLLDQDPAPYRDAMVQKTRPPQVAKIHEEQCIGCTKCIQACPVDAIFGTAKHMHVIIAHDCTGCGLCIEPCPVDCIELLELPETQYDKTMAQQAYERKQQRLLREQQKQAQQYQQKRCAQAQSDASQAAKEAKKAYILAAIQRAKKPS